MMVDYQKKYKDSESNMPHDGAERSDSWYAGWAKYIWSLYAGNFCGLGYGGVRSSGRTIAELRSYARGQQSTAKHRDWLDPMTESVVNGVEKKDGARLWNISWQPLMILPKYRDIARQRISRTQFGIQTQAIDAVSLSEKEEKVLAARIRLHPAMQALAVTAGLDRSSGIPGINSQEDLDVVEKLGGIRLDREIMIKDALDTTEYASNMEVLKGMNVDDIIDLNIAAKEVVCDRNERVVKYKYVDPARLVYRPSIYPDCRDIDFAGYWEDVTLASLRQECSLREEDLIKMARLAGNTIEPNWDNAGDRQAYFNRYGSLPYDSAKLRVFRCYWVANKAEDYLKGVNTKYGNYVFKKVDNGKKQSVGDYRREREVQRNNIHCVYKCNWLVGTDFVFGHGEAESIVRDGQPGSKVARLPIQIYQSDSPSMIERCIAHVDDADMANFKIRHMLATFPAFMMWWDKTLLRDSIKIGKKQFSMLQMVQRAMSTGFGIYESRSEFGSLEQGSNRPPFHFEKIDFSAMTEQAAVYDRAVQQIREVTGINEVADGTAGGPDMLVRVMEGLDAATNMALSPYAFAYKTLYETSSRYAAKKWQLAAMHGEIDLGYYRDSFQRVKLTKDIAGYDFGIRIVSMPSEKDRQELLNMLFQKTAAGQVSQADMIPVWRALRENDLVKAQFWLAKADEKRQRDEFQKQQALVQQQVEGNRMAGEAVEKQKQQTADMKVRGEAAIEAAKLPAELAKIAEESKARKEEIILEKSLERQLQESEK